VEIDSAPVAFRRGRGPRMKAGQIGEKWIPGRSEGQNMILRSSVVRAGVAALVLVFNVSAADLVDTAAAGQFNTLVAAVKAAGLVDALKGPGPFTVFAPTDEAFAKLPPGTLDNLLKPENKDRLQKILTYHVVAGKVTAKDVMKLRSAKTLEGGNLAIHAGDGGVMVSNAHVTKTDIAASNGVIHVIDKVLLPDSR
jgi:uncharacterized surface protein with fasciclin (FAS1) repeats